MVRPIALRGAEEEAENGVDRTFELHYEHCTACDRSIPDTRFAPDTGDEALDLEKKELFCDDCYLDMEHNCQAKSFCEVREPF